MGKSTYGSDNAYRTNAIDMRLGLNDSDLRVADAKSILAAKAAWSDAYRRGDAKGMQQAHAQAEAIRKSNGYSGGTAGNQYIASKKVTQAQPKKVQPTNIASLLARALSKRKAGG